jgi:membrane-associated phospholipid phosphatase
MSTAAAMRLASPGAWALPLAALLLAAVLALTGENRSAFLALNALGPMTNDWFWANITILGDTAVALTLCLPLWRRRPDLVWALAIGAVLATAWVHVLKPIVSEPRPAAVLGDAVHIIGPAFQHDSFPSGHATTAFALAGLLALGLRAGWWAAPFALVAGMVAVSRSVVGVHWPVDLLAGAFGGWLAATLGLVLARRFPIGLSPWLQGLMALAMAGCAVALLAGYDTGYPQAVALQRAIAIACLLAAVLALVRRWLNRE